MQKNSPLLSITMIFAALALAGCPAAPADNNTNNANNQSDMQDMVETDMPPVEEDATPDMPPVEEDMTEDVVEPPPVDLAKLQIIHASADAGAGVVDVYVNDTLLIDDLAFKEGTNFFDVEAGVSLKIDITAGGAADNSAPAFTATLDDGLVKDGSYSVVATGSLAENAGDAAFDLLVLPAAKTSGTAGEVNFAVVHGVSDAPAVDIVVDNNSETPLLDAVPFKAFTADGDGKTAYTTVTPDGFTFGSLGLVDVYLDGGGYFQGFQQDFSALDGASLIIIATGSVTDDTFSLTAFPASDGETPTKAAGVDITKSARAQIIHNSADPAAEVVDVYANDVRILDDFAFRDASPFISVPSSVELDIDVTTSRAEDNTSPVWSTSDSSNPTLAADSTQVLVASGVIRDAFTMTDGRDISFGLLAIEGQEAPGKDVRGETVLANIVHGSTDAPIVGVGAGGTVLLGRFDYGDSTGYVELPGATDVVLDIIAPTDARTYTETLLNTETPVPLTAVTGQAVVVLASGFLTPEENADGAPIGLLIVPAFGATGNKVLFVPTVPTPK